MLESGILNVTIHHKLRYLVTFLGRFLDIFFNDTDNMRE